MIAFLFLVIMSQQPGGGGAAAPTSKLPTDPEKLAKIQKVLNFTEEQLQRLPAAAAAKIRIMQAQYRR